MVSSSVKNLLPLHQQKKGIYKKGQDRIGRASHGCLSIFVPNLAQVTDSQ